MRRLRALHRRYTKAVDRVTEIEAARNELYLEARALDPPLTFESIARVFGVTSTAVMQKVGRHNVKQAKKRTST